MNGRYRYGVMDPLLAANQLPRIAERAMRRAIRVALLEGRMTPRALVSEALISFEQAVRQQAGEGVRRALLFAERDRIAREIRGFVDGRMAARLAAVRRRDIVAHGREAAPFDLILRGRRGRLYAVVFRRFPKDGRRLDLLRRLRFAAKKKTTALAGVVAFDFTSGRWRTVPCGERAIALAA